MLPWVVALAKEAGVAPDQRENISGRSAVGSVLALDARGRWFKSSRLDQKG